MIVTIRIVICYNMSLYVHIVKNSASHTYNKTVCSLLPPMSTIYIAIHQLYCVKLNLHYTSHSHCSDECIFQLNYVFAVRSANITLVLPHTTIFHQRTHLFIHLTIATYRTCIHMHAYFSHVYENSIKSQPCTIGSTSMVKLLVNLVVSSRMWWVYVY